MKLSLLNNFKNKRVTVTYNDRETSSIIHGDLLSVEHDNIVIKAEGTEALFQIPVKDIRMIKELLK